MPGRVYNLSLDSEGEQNDWILALTNTLSTIADIKVQLSDAAHVLLGFETVCIEHVSSLSLQFVIREVYITVPTPPTTLSGGA